MLCAPISFVGAFLRGRPFLAYYYNRGAATECRPHNTLENHALVAGPASHPLPIQELE